MKRAKSQISELGAVAVETALLFVVAPIFFFGLFDLGMMFDSVSVSADTAVLVRLSDASLSRSLGIGEGGDLPLRRNANLSAARRAALDLEFFRGDTRLRDATNRVFANSRFGRRDVASERDSELSTTTRRRVSRLTRSTDINLSNGSRRRVSAEDLYRPTFRPIWQAFNLNIARSRTIVPELPTVSLSRDLS